METVFHEKQEGQLCAQHCLNSLLQGPYYTAVDLAAIAEQLDVEERQSMASGRGGEDSSEFRQFIAQPSGNMDDTGFFSVQVIEKAIQVWGLGLISYRSSAPVAVSARSDPNSQRAYICNYREHWFTVRKLGNQWFNLNSLLTGPELVSNTYLSLFLAQLETEGYVIYLVTGDLPESAADQILRAVPVVQAIRPEIMNVGGGGAASKATSAGGAGPVMGTSGVLASEDDDDLRAAMAMSLRSSQMSGSGAGEDEDMNLALHLSRTMMESQGAAAVQASLEDQSNVISEEDELQRAIALSLQSNAKPAQVPAAPVKKESGGADSQNPMRNALPSSAAGTASPGSGGQTISASATKAATPAVAATAVTATSQESRWLPSSGNVSGNSPQGTKPKSTISKPTAGPSTMPGQGQSIGGPSLARGQQRESTPDPEEVRRRRQAFLAKLQDNKNP